MRVKKKRFLGMPIPDRELSREELRELSEEDVKRLGFETRFWPWYFQTSWSVARIAIVLYLLGIAIGFGTSFLSGSAFDYISFSQKFLRLMIIALIAPVIVLVVSYSWWYGSIAIDKIRGGS